MIYKQYSKPKTPAEVFLKMEISYLTRRVHIWCLICGVIISVVSSLILPNIQIQKVIFGRRKKKREKGKLWIKLQEIGKNNKGSVKTPH